MAFITMVLSKDELKKSPNKLTERLDYGWEIVSSTTLVRSVATGSQYSTVKEWGSVAYVLQIGD